MDRDRDRDRERACCLCLPRSLPHALHLRVMIGRNTNTASFGGVLTFRLGRRARTNGGKGL